MKQRALGREVWMLAAVVAVFVAACGDDNGTAATPSTATPTRTATATRTLAVPTATPTKTSPGVAGLVVVNRNVAPNARHELGAPPAVWEGEVDAKSFDKSLSNADWSVDGIPGAGGLTGPDGTFAIGDLAPGPHTLQVTKTLDGNLLPLTIPFTVGDDGKTGVVAEVSWGLVRTVSTYTQNGAQMRDVRGPYGSWLITRDGRVVELGNPSRAFVDPDGDERFDVKPCLDRIWTCNTDASCAEDRYCQCVAPCPFCDACLMPGVCVTKGTLPPYTCNEDRTCVQPGDHCVCVSSCPECKDCPQRVCVPSCAPMQLTGMTVGGPSQLVIGQEGSMYATALFSDGSQFDVTTLAEWQSSNDAAATVNSWGTVSAHALGSTDVAASLGSLSSKVWPIAVVERPTLRRITVQNSSCYYPMGRPEALDPTTRPPALPPIAGDMLPRPTCGQVVQIGATLQFTAMGEFENGYYEDLTKEVQWQVNPSEVGDVVNGLFTARQAGTAKLTASLGAVASDATEIKVVTQPTVVGLSIYPGNWAFVAIDGGPIREGMPVPCFDCGAAVTLLRGDQLKFQATAQYDTGEWRDVTAEVTWRSTDAAVATIDAAGVMTAVQAGTTTVDATLDGITSNPVDVNVVSEATLQSLAIYQEGGDRVVAKGDQRFFRATGYYDVGFSRDVTKEATWRSSDENVGHFESAGVFVGHAAGTVQVWAELGGLKSEPLSLEVYETSELAYCDPDNINRSYWSDDFNRVVLESDCAAYTQPGVVALRYTVTETQPHGGIFDPCLDLYVYGGDTRIRTIREEGCGEPFVPGAAPGRDEAVLKYQLRAFWDLKDEKGNPVAPGTYTIYGRFYLYYDPVVKILVTVVGPGEPLPTRPPTPTPPPAVGHEVVIRIGTAGGAPGDHAKFDVTLQAPEVAVAAVQNDIVFGGKIRIDETPSGKPNCQVNPAISKAPTAFFFLPAGCHGADCDRVRATVFARDNVDPIPDGSVLYTCSLTIPAGSEPSGYPLYCAGAVAGDPSDGALAVKCVDGGVRVRGAEPPPPPEPTPQVEGLCFHGSEICQEGPVRSSQSECCTLFQFSMSPLAFSWCPADQINPSTGKCNACSDRPCEGLPTPTPTVPRTRCGGFAGFICEPGYVCVDDPNDSCDPRTGADCPGVCLPEPLKQCTRDEDCPTLRAPCAICPDGSAACPRSYCEAGTCRVAFDVCQATPTPGPVCTPALCAPGEVVYCADSCPGGCGTACATPTPVPTAAAEGMCFRDPEKCGGPGFPTSQARCCALAQQSLSPLPITWCPAQQIESATGQCRACTEPCTGEPYPLSTLEEHCGTQTGAALLANVRPEYRTTLLPRPEIDLPQALPLTVRVSYQHGSITCYPRQIPPPGSTRPEILEQVGVIVAIEFRTDGGEFEEEFEAELKGGAGGGDFSFHRRPEALQGTYRPDLPGYQDVVMVFYGRFDGDWTNGVVAQSGQRRGHASEFIPVAYWQPDAAQPGNV